MATAPAPPPLMTRRRRLGPFAILVLGAAMGLLLTGLVVIPRVLAPVVTDEPAALTARVVRGAGPGQLGLPTSQVVVARGEVPTPGQVALVASVRTPLTATTAGTLALGAILGLFLSAALRLSARGRQLQTQLAVFSTLAALTIVAQLLAVTTNVSPLAFPLAGLALAAAHVIDRNAGLAVAIAGAGLLAALTPFDALACVVLGTQALTAVLCLARGRGFVRFLVAGVLGALCAAVAATALTAAFGGPPVNVELVAPARSAVLAALAGGLIAGPLSLVLIPMLERGSGGVSRGQLAELCDLQQPLLRQLSSSASGTWQHSLAVANMSEIAASAIGANPMLARAGAYYHDLGKLLAPAEYADNLSPGATDPDSLLTPEAAAAVHFAHIVEGVRLARQHGLPEAIVDFVHMHHGNSIAERLWLRCLTEGNPRGLPELAFRYPGVPPQSRETAVVSIVNAVEIASRQLRNPDGPIIDAVVEDVIYARLVEGQLDESGLSVADLRTLARTLGDTLKAAHHVRRDFHGAAHAPTELASAMGTGPTGEAARAAAADLNPTRPARALGTRPPAEADDTTSVSVSTAQIIVAEVQAEIERAEKDKAGERAPSDADTDSNITTGQILTSQVREELDRGDDEGENGENVIVASDILAEKPVTAPPPDPDLYTPLPIALTSRKTGESKVVAAEPKPEPRPAADAKPDANLEPKPEPKAGETDGKVKAELDPARAPTDAPPAADPDKN
jgi:putative nucleotidyltransferase with HDIG domain